jgi:hypothetical protein
VVLPVLLENNEWKCGMNFDFLSRRFLERARDGVTGFRKLVEESEPDKVQLDDLLTNVRAFAHTVSLDREFRVAGVDGSGESPVLQQDDVFMHFVIAAGTIFQTASERQHKLSILTVEDGIYADFIALRDERKAVQAAYAGFLDRLIGITPRLMAERSDYIEVFNATSQRAHIQLGDVVFPNRRMAFSKASEIASNAYQIRSLAELAMAIRLLDHRPDYLLIDTSLVYFLLGESIYLPELLKRYLICRATELGTCVIALSKSHNIPNGNLIARRVKEEIGFADHWYLRLPSDALGESRLPWLEEKEVPPKLGVSYLFKFHSADFPMRIDLDAGWWSHHIRGEEAAERRLFQDLDFTCHDSRSYGYPYPLRASHRRSALTKQERAALRDVVVRLAAEQGILRPGLQPRDPEMVHAAGI